MSTLVCPNCENPLSDSGNKSYSCELNHSFDLSKEGYLNLLAVNQKKSKSPGDNEMMVAARRDFLELGHYSPLIESLITTIKEELTFANKKPIVLDAGCGEGYYSEHVLNKVIGFTNQIIGTDISKSAIRSAAKKYKDNFYFVSSVYNLPIAVQSINLILSIFSPIHPEEFQRVLSKDGYIIVVSPAENHLKELAELIYDNFRPHKEGIEEKMHNCFQTYCTKRTTFSIQLKEPETLLNLLKMTPYYWTASQERLEKLKRCEDISITCDFNIAVFKAIQQ